MAFFGGSFDPPHLGHIAVARAARDALHLDRVLFAPVGAQPLKPTGSTAPFADRVAMTELAIAGERGFEVSLADAPDAAGQPNYTLETLRRLRAGLPAEGCLFCLMGADSFASLRRWHRAAEIPFTAALIVASRPGQRLDDLARYLPAGLALGPSARAEAHDHSAAPAARLKSCPDTKAASNQLFPKTESEAPEAEVIDAPDAAPEHPEAATETERASTPATIELCSFLVRNPAGETAPFYVLPGLHIEISASEIRAQVRSSSQEAVAANSLLPAPVAEYIRTRALYR